MNKSDEVLKLIENAQYEEAYSLCDELLKHQKSSQILFYRCIIDFPYLKKHTSTTLHDLYYLATKSKEFGDVCKQLYIFLAGEEGLVDEVCAVGPKFIEDLKKADNDTLLNGDVYLTVARGLYYDDFEGNYDQIIKYLDEGLKLEGDPDNETLLSVKVDYLCEHGDYDQANKTLVQMQTSSGASGLLYYQKAHLEELLGHFDEALNYLEFAKNYEFTEHCIFASEYRIYTITSQIQKVKQIIEDYKDITSDMKCELLMRSYLEMPKPNPFMALLTGYRYIIKNDNNLATINKFIQIVDKDYLHDEKYEKYLHRLNLIKPLLAKVLKESGTISFENLILNCYRDTNDIDTLYELCDDVYNKHHDPAVGLLCATIMDEKGINYDEIEELTLKCVEDGGYNEFYRYWVLQFITKDPESLIKIQNFFLKQPVKLLNNAQVAHLASICINGGFGVKPDPLRAKPYIDNLESNETMDVADMLITGRYYEKGPKDYTKAFEYYKKAYQLEHEIEHYNSYSSDPFLVNCYLKGIGTNVNIEKGKTMLLNIFERDFHYFSNDAVYLYCYFALKGDKDFSLEKALNYLNHRHSFSRYEIRRYMFLRLIKKRLGLDYHMEETKIKRCLKLNDPGDHAFYKKHHKDTIIYPE